MNRLKRGTSGWLSVIAAVSALVGGSLTLAASNTSIAAASMAAVTPGRVGGTAITIDGSRPGAVFDGIGAISGGGGNSRYLIDYPAAARSQILNFLFGPGGAHLQILKLEIGGDANSSDGSEASIEHQSGQIDCQSGYEWWLAEQALARDKSIKLYGLQWAAPGWVRSVWSRADVGYVIKWLNCAKSHHLKISYLGGWNENGFNVAWYENMRAALNASGYRSVKIVASDDISSRAWKIADAAVSDPKLKAAIGILGAHDTCAFPTLGYHCTSTKNARKLGKPLWESELGAMDANTGAPDLARSVNNGYIQAGITGYVEWPLVDAMPPGLPFENRGLVTADEPQSGFYLVNRIAWAIAQTTQFVQPGWRHVNGANAELGNSGSYNAYEAPNGHDWSLVAENTGHSPGQVVPEARSGSVVPEARSGSVVPEARSGKTVGPQTITVRLTGGLTTGTVHVWSTNLNSADSSTWFVRQPDIDASSGSFSYSIPAGSQVSFTSTSGQSHLTSTLSSPGPITLPYQAVPDGSNEAWALAAQEGAFIYRRCLPGLSGQCLEQLAPRIPVWWHKPAVGTPTPYAIVGDPTWRNYTVKTKVLFTKSSGRASLIGRFGSQGGDKRFFTGYEASLSATGRWQITRDSNVASPVVLANGSVTAIRPGTWHVISFGLHGTAIAFSVDGHVVGRATNGRWSAGLAGIGSNWGLVQFGGLTVS